jgi:hypothetical protein
MRKWMILSVLCAFGVGTSALIVRATAEGSGPQPKYTTKEIMQLAHKKLKLFPKVVKGEATEKEKLKLLELFVWLRENDPPKGKKAAWDQRCNDLLAATCKVVLGYKGSEKKLKKASNCGGCHKLHKGK